MSHTEGKLSARGKWIDDANGGVVAETSVLGRPNGEGVANARRLVACCNAMNGIDDPELWVAQMKFIDSDHTISVGIIRELQQERDELLNTLRFGNSKKVEAILARYQEGK